MKRWILLCIVPVVIVGMLLATPSASVAQFGSKGFAPNNNNFNKNNNNNFKGPSDSAIITKGILDLGTALIKSSNNGNNGGNNNKNNYPPVPGWIPNNNQNKQPTIIYQPQPQPQTVYIQAPPAPVAAPPAAPPAPVAVPKENAKPAPTLVKSNPNSIAAKVKSATAADLATLKKAIGVAQENLVGKIEEELKEFRLERSSLIVEMAKLNVDVVDQTAMLQALKKGDAERAQILWTKITKDPLKGEELAHKVELHKWFDDLVALSEDGGIGSAELRAGKRLFADLDLSAKTKKTLNAHLAALEENSALADVIGKLKAVAGAPTKALPASGFTIIRNPKCDAVCWLGDGYVMVPGGETLAIESNGTVCGAMGWPLGSDSPCPTTDSKWTYEGVLLNGPEGEGQVNYIISNNNYTINAGQTQRLDAGTSYTITFFPGGKAAKKTYALTDGSYKFAPVDGAWELQSHKYAIDLNNRANTNVFHAVIDNVRVEIPAGEVKTFESKYPIDVKFDRGNGTSERNVRLEKGSYKIAVHPTDNLWDLYSADQFAGDPVASK
ncbi:MAG: hypothetical protein QM811_18250 [Pirellulales bacterium]